MGGMIRELVIDCTPPFTRAAVLEDGRLCELHSERDNADRLTETLFYGRVQAIKPALHAAFIDIGMDQNAFLPLQEDETMRCGEMLIVQGSARQSTESKGLRVTQKINLAGKWLVLIPGETGIHVSKKVKDAALRCDLVQTAQSVCPPGCGLIVRTVSEEWGSEQLREEAESLFALWQSITKRAQGMMRPGVIHERPSLVRQLVRDLAGSDMKRIITNSARCMTALQAELDVGHIAPHTTLTLFEERTQLLFDAFQLEKEIDQALKKRAWLPCGGYLILDYCEALTVIDVNSGKMTDSRNTEDTALRVNLEAVREIARQIRLRDVGGILVCDLIDMQQQEHKEAVLCALREAVRADRSKVSVEGITRLGLLEMTRSRKGAQLRRMMRVSCSYCSGLGEVISPEETAQRALRQVRRMALSGQRGPFVIRCAVSTAQVLCTLAPIELLAQVYVLGVPGRHMQTFDVEQIDPPQDAYRLCGEGGTASARKK